MGYLTKYGYVLKKKNYPKSMIDFIKNSLYVMPKGDTFFSTDANGGYFNHRETRDYLVIPKNFGIQQYGLPKKEFNVSGLPTRMMFNGKLRDHQLDVATYCIEQIRKFLGGVITLPCGGGKTVLALYIACIFNLKTLIIVHKSPLQIQWIDRIKQFTNASVGLIRQSKIDVEGKDIVVGMLQSISMRHYDKSIFKDFGLVIYDEVHHMGAKVFSKAFAKTCAKYTIGLTATPYRSDGLMNVVYWYVGNQIHLEKRKECPQTLVKRFIYDTDNPTYVERKFFFKKRMVPAIPTMISALGRNFQRNHFIIKIINHLILHNPHRKILILSDRVKHLEILKNAIDKLIKTYENKKILCEDEIKTYYYIGDCNENKRKEAQERGDILFATYPMAEEGLDIPKLNTIIMATPSLCPIEKFDQPIGRILRKEYSEGDIKPLIIDIIDNFSTFPSHGEKREKYYKKLNYDVSDYHAFNKNLVDTITFLVLKLKWTREKVLETFDMFDKDESISFQEIFDVDNV